VALLHLDQQVLSSSGLSSSPMNIAAYLLVPTTEGDADGELSPR
jgi:hypothetical protein